MKKYAVGDVVMVPMTVVEVHEQGLPSGLDEFGRPKNPNEKASPDRVVLTTPDGLESDAHGRVHFNADADL